MEELILQSKKTILIVCRSINEVRFLSHIKPQSEYCYVIASDDIRVQKVVNEYTWVNEVCWIEQMESFFNVANDVITFVDIINKWLESLGDDKNGIPKDLLFWIKHAEGGMTTQRIQDMLLLIRSYLHLFESNNITDIIILSHPGMQWEDDVLIETTRSRNIDVKVIGSKRPGVLKGKVMALFNLCAREPYFILNILLAKVNNLFRMKKENYEKEIIFQLCSSANKHSENIIPIMRSLENMKCNPKALCWRASGGADKVRQEGLQVEELEQYVSISDLGTGVYKIIRTWKKAKKQYPEFLIDKKLKYRSVPIGRLLWPSVNFFFIAELAQRYRLSHAIRNYFDNHSPLCIKLWGGGKLIEGDLVVKYWGVKENKPLFINWFWTFFDNPYDSGENITTFLAVGDSQKNYLERCGVPADKIVLTGLPRYDSLLNFREHISKEQSFVELDIPTTYSIYILYDSSSILRGYLSISEQMETADFLLDFAMRHPDVALIIKPHPGYHSGFLDFLIDSYSLQNVFLIEKSMLPYHAFNVADILITKFSTIGIEAMFFDIPVISLILDNEERFRIYEDAANYITTTKELDQLLTELNDTSNRIKWNAERIEKQKLFLNRFFYKLNQKTAEFAANAIENLIIK